MWHGSSDVHSMSRSCIRNPKRHASISILSIQKRKLQMQRPHCSAYTPIQFGITFSTTQEENTTNIQDYFEINSWLTIMQRSGSRDGIATSKAIFRLPVRSPAGPGEHLPETAITEGFLLPDEALENTLLNSVGNVVEDFSLGR